MSYNLTPTPCENPGNVLSQGATGTVQIPPMASRPCRPEDLSRVAEIHKAQFNTSGTLLGRLSPTLIVAFYEAFLGRSVFLLHQSEGQIDGFVLGGPSRTMMRCRFSFLCKHALWCIAEAVRRPRLWLLAFRSLLKLAGDRFASMTGGASEGGFHLVSLAVAASIARKGVGTALVRDFEGAIRAHCRAYSLSVLKNNPEAIRFYEKLGFQRAGETAISWILRKELA